MWTTSPPKGRTGESLSDLQDFTDFCSTADPGSARHARRQAAAGNPAGMSARLGGADTGVGRDHLAGQKAGAVPEVQDGGVSGYGPAAGRSRVGKDGTGFRQTRGQEASAL